MDTAVLNHYEVLGVAADATDAEIKRAWARKVREHPPDKDAETNQRINEAKQVLLDPKARARYDAHLQHGPEIGALLLQAMLAANAEDHCAAADALRKAVALAPDDDSLRNFWALETKRAGDPAAAVRILRGLVQRAPDVPLYLYNLATMLWEIEGGDEQARLQESLRLLRQAVQLEPHNSDYHVGLARCFVKMKNYDAAEQAIEDALMTDGEINVQDLDTLFELPVIHILAGKPEKVKADTTRILGVIADLDEDIHRYCGYRFAKLAIELCELKGFDDANHCANAAVRCSPNDPDLKGLFDHTRTLCKIMAELTELQNDGSMPAFVKVLVAARGLVEIDASDSKEATAHYREAALQLDHTPARTLVMAFERARSVYPTLYGLGREDFDSWRATAARISSGQTQPAATPQGAGCVLPALLVAGAFILLTIAIM